MRTVRRHPHPARQGFTLLEVWLVTIIVGVGTLAMMELIGTGTQMNARNYRETTAMHLANNLREYTREATLNDAVNLDGDEWTPPIDARGRQILSLNGWAQTLSVQKVDVSRLTTDVPNASVASAARVTVNIKQHDVVVYSASWLVFASN